jgi:hypothetical protein
VIDRRNARGPGGGRLELPAPSCARLRRSPQRPHRGRPGRGARSSQRHRASGQHPPPDNMPMRSRARAIRIR